MDAPDPPAVGFKSSGDGSVTVTVTGVIGRAYFRTRKCREGEAFTAENIAKSTTSDGDYALTGLDNGERHEIVVYNLNGGIRSEWVTCYGTPADPDAVANQELYRIIGVDKVPGAGTKTLRLQKVGKPIVPLGD